MKATVFKMKIKRSGTSKVVKVQNPVQSKAEITLPAQETEVSYRIRQLDQVHSLLGKCSLKLSPGTMKF